jgi:hypothetical protein
MRNQHVILKLERSIMSLGKTKNQDQRRINCIVNQVVNINNQLPRAHEKAYVASTFV